MVIPHCRMITELLKGAGKIPRGTNKAVISHTPFDWVHLNRPDFQFKETLTHWVLRDEVNKHRQEFLKPTEEEQAGGEEEEEEEGRGEYDHYGGRERFLADPNYPVGYQHWSPYERTMYGRQEYHWEQQHLFNEQLDERLTKVEQTVDVMAYYQLRYHHDLYNYAEQSRHHHDYTSGLPYQPQPPVRDYATMPPHEWQSTEHQPISFPGMTQPAWYGRRQQHADSGESSSSSQPPETPDPFDMRPLAQGLFEDFFWQWYPR